MPEISAGLLLYRRTSAGAEVLLVHPGGPFWAKKDDGSWSIPKGLVDPGEDQQAAARREFAEETGALAPPGGAVALGEFRQPSGKQIVAFAIEGDFALASLVSNTFEMEWPPRSGRREAFPEVDQAGWFAPETARLKLLKGQLPILDALLQHLMREEKAP